MPDAALTARAATPLIDVIHNITPSQLSAPTPCTEYDVGKLVNHLLFWGPSLEGAARKELVAPPAETEADVDLTCGEWATAGSGTSKGCEDRVLGRYAVFECTGVGPHTAKAARARRIASERDTCSLSASLSTAATNPWHSVHPSATAPAGTLSPLHTVKVKRPKVCVPDVALAMAALTTAAPRARRARPLPACTLAPSGLRRGSRHA